MAKKGNYIVLFVEGETEKEFYQALLKYYFDVHNAIPQKYKIINIKGISRFETKVISKLKYEIIPTHNPASIKVFCCYDSDVFELAQKPPTNWLLVKKRVKELGIHDFNEIKAVRMIEDWFLKDAEGLCKFLNVEIPQRIEGRDGLEKIKYLFKKGKTPKIYQKGSYCHKFMLNISMSKIRNSQKNELVALEKALGIK